MRNKELYRITRHESIGVVEIINIINHICGTDSKTLYACAIFAKCTCWMHSMAVIYGFCSIDRQWRGAYGLVPNSAAYHIAIDSKWVLLSNSESSNSIWECLITVTAPWLGSTRNDVIGDQARDQNGISISMIQKPSETNQNGNLLTVFFVYFIWSKINKVNNNQCWYWLFRQNSTTTKKKKKNPISIAKAANLGKPYVYRSRVKLIKTRKLERIHEQSIDRIV